MARKNLINVKPIELVVEHDQPMATSLQVAKHFGKDHNHVLRDIKNLIPNLPKGWAASNFGPMLIDVEIGNGAIRQDPAYRMTRDGFSLLAMGFTGEKALAWKLKYLEAFNAMERELWSRKFGMRKTTRGTADPVILQRVIRALTAYWSVIDNISLKQAQAYLCTHLGIRSLADMNNEHYNAALDFCFDNAYRLHQKTGRLNPEQQESLQALLSAFKDTYANVAEDTDLVYRRCLGIDDFNAIGTEDLPKVAACFWSILNQFIQYNKYNRFVK
jgi:Rha family phage regulatory protein